MAHDVSQHVDSIVGESVGTGHQFCADDWRAFTDKVRTMLLHGADVDDLRRLTPGLTQDELYSLLGEVLARCEAAKLGADTNFISPQDFYREAVQREDIRRILASLAK
jgi:hypothetical protein